MNFKDYEVNPLAVGAGGLAGAGLGVAAYLLGRKRGIGRLATYASIGAALGLGTGALATLVKKKSQTEINNEATKKELESRSDSELWRESGNGWGLGLDLGGAGTGYLASRITRGKLMTNPTDEFTQKALAATYEKPTPGTAAKAEVLAQPAELRVNGKTLVVDPAHADMTKISNPRQTLTDTTLVNILRDNGVDLVAEGIETKSGKINWDRLHKFRNDRVTFIDAVPYSPAVAAVPGTPGRLIIDGIDRTDDALRALGDSADLSKLTDAQKKYVAKTIKMLDSVGPRYGDKKASAFSKILRVLGVGGRKRLRSILGLIPDAAGATAGYFGAHSLSNFTVDKAALR